MYSIRWSAVLVADTALQFIFIFIFLNFFLNFFFEGLYFQFLYFKIDFQVRAPLQEVTTPPSLWQELSNYLSPSGSEGCYQGHHTLWVFIFIFFIIFFYYQGHHTLRFFFSFFFIFITRATTLCEFFYFLFYFFYFFFILFFIYLLIFFFEGLYFQENKVPGGVIYALIYVDFGCDWYFMLCLSKFQRK